MFPFPDHLLPTEPTEDSAVLIRELATHLWGRVRAAVASVAPLADRLPPPDRESLTRSQTNTYTSGSNC